MDQMDRDSPEMEPKTSESPDSGYTCPMHEEVRSAQPGNCPKCEMALVPVV